MAWSVLILVYWVAGVVGGASAHTDLPTVEELCALLDARDAKIDRIALNFDSFSIRRDESGKEIKKYRVNTTVILDRGKKYLRQENKEVDYVTEFIWDTEKTYTIWSPAKNAAIRRTVKIENRENGIFYTNETPLAFGVTYSGFPFGEMLRGSTEVRVLPEKPIDGEPCVEVLVREKSWLWRRLFIDTHKTLLALREDRLVAADRSPEMSVPDVEEVSIDGSKYVVTGSYKVLSSKEVDGVWIPQHGRFVPYGFRKGKPVQGLEVELKTVELAPVYERSPFDPRIGKDDKVLKAEGGVIEEEKPGTDERDGMLR